MVALSTVCYVILTWQLVKETRLTREFKETPFLAASIHFTETNRKIIRLKIKNIGLGYAKNVNFDIIKDFELSQNYSLSERGAFKNGIQSFPPNYELDYVLCVFELGKEKPISDEDYVELKINYQNIYDKEFSNQFRLKFNEIISQGYGSIPFDNESAKVYYLAEINKRLTEMNKKEINQDIKE